ncbi:MAG: hypothetical protein RIQ53_722 [Pseudomonadota bacterium]|jgi:hypothetical protein
MGRENEPPHAAASKIVSIIQMAAEPATGAVSAVASRWRNDRRKTIDALCINHLGDRWAYVEFTLAQFGTVSLADLADLELERTYLHIKARAAP